MMNHSHTTTLLIVWYIFLKSPGKVPFPFVLKRFGTTLPLVWFSFPISAYDSLVDDRSRPLLQETLSATFCLLVPLLSSSISFNLFFIAAILALRLICPELRPVRLDLFDVPTLWGAASAVSIKDFSLARRTVNGRPQINFPCIFSLASSASWLYTLMVEIRNC